MRNSYTALFILCLTYVAVFSLSSFSSFWWLSCLIEIAAFAAAAILSKRLLICQASPRDYDIGFSVRSLPLSLPFLPFFIGGVILLSNASSALANAVGYVWDYPYEENIWICLFASALLPAVLEELFCRYIFLPRLTVYSRGGAILASAIFFSLLHGNFIQIPYAFFAGLFLGSLAVFCGSVVPCILFHFCNNAVSVLLHFYGDTVLPRVLLWVLVGSLIVGAAAMILLRRQIRQRVRCICAENDDESKEIKGSATKRESIGKVTAGLFTSPLVLLLILFVAEAVLSV